jgi:hypothetical protein
MRRGLRATLVVATALAVTVPVCQVTVADVFRARDPSLVQRIAPFDAQSAAMLAYREATQTGGGDRLQADALAAKALRRDPTATLAVVARGLIAAQRGNAAAAHRWFLYADRLSKRHLATQIWFIEERVRAGDVPGALARYDLALRASPSAGTLLFPVLAQAASDAEIGNRLNALLRSRPAWGPQVISYMIAKSDNHAAIVNTTAGVLNLDPTQGREQLAALIARLVSEGSYDLAWRAYRTFGNAPGGAATVRDGSFSNTASVGAFEWTYPDVQSLLPERGQDGGKSVLYLPGSPDQDGDAVKQLVKVSKGSWTLQAIVGANTKPSGDAPRLRLTCAGPTGATLAEMPFPQSITAKRITGRFVVPATCGYAWVTVKVRQPAEPTPDTRAWITDINLAQR